MKYVCNQGGKAMNTDIRKRIDELKKINGFETDADIIYAIYYFKKARGETGKIKDFEFVENNKGSYSQCFSGRRKFKEEDYLAIEYVLNTSMAFILEGKGEISKDFKPSGIRYAAFTDTIGNYEELIREEIINSSDEYNKMLIDYMIEYKSKNGFIYFAERNMLPLSCTGGYNFDSNCLNYFPNDNKKLLIVLCELLPLDLLIKYFDGFLNYQDIVYSQIDERQNTSFTDEVIAKAIEREDLRKALTTCRKINLDAYNRGIRLGDEKTLGEGLFANYGLSVMMKYVLNHDVDDSVRLELLEGAIKVNRESFEFASTFAEEELKIDKYGYITNQYGRIYYGSIAVPSEATVEISNQSTELLNQLNRQVRNYHEFISNHSKISVFANEVLADKQDNHVYYDFFKLMNGRGIKIIPLLKENATKDKDLFEVSNSEKSRIANGTDEDLKIVIRAIKLLDEISIKDLNGQTYYLIDPSIYMLGDQVNYIMPKDVCISNKYSNLVHFINDNAMWSFYETRNKVKIDRFIHLLKIYGLSKDELDEFIRDFIVLSEEQAQSIDKTSDRGKELALKTLENKAWIEIYYDSILKEF